MASALAPLLVALGLGSGCAPSTEFIYEGPGQPPDRAPGTVPEGALGVCKRPGSKRPPLVNKSLWEHSLNCKDKTPHRFVRVGYGKMLRGEDTVADERMRAMMDVLQQSASEPNANVKMLQMMRTVRQQGKDDPLLRARIERSTARASSCDYHYLLHTTSKHLARGAEGAVCPAKAYDAQLRREQCLFDVSRKEAMWLTSAWGCVAFTGTLGEGQSCFRMCEYDDYCASQVSCATADMDLLLCALGVCLPEKVAGVY